jgi:hypothetical protein
MFLIGMDPPVQNTYLKEHVIVGTNENLIRSTCGMHGGGGVVKIKDFDWEFSGEQMYWDR